jgi:metal-sulfur cluster biosynthetic enzyme
MKKRIVYSCENTESDGVREIQIAMTMSVPGCGMSQVLKPDVERKRSSLPTVRQVRVQVVFDPPRATQRMAEAIHLQLGLNY